MMRFPQLACAAVVVAASAAAASAQPQLAPPEPSTPARIQFGPLSVRPALILRDVGLDSNVFNEADNTAKDFTATIGARAELGLRLPRVVANYSSFYEYVYFQTFESERGSNRGTEGRVDVLLGRLRPYFLGGISNSHDRPNSEIDARAERQTGSIGAGLAAAVFSRTAVNVGYRRNTVDYANGESFRGVALADELNGHSGMFTFGADVELSPLTTVSVHGERMTERFDFSPDRDANSHRYGVTATLHPQALISGRATVGLRAYRPQNPAIRDFTGITAAIAVAYAFHDDSRLALTIDRDLRQSFAEATPYFVATGGRVTFTQRLIRNIDGQLVAGIDRINYEARLDGPAIQDQHDRVRTLGAGVGIRASEGTRIGLNFDHTQRTSPVDLREYSRGRLYATMTYGF